MPNTVIHRSIRRRQLIASGKIKEQKFPIFSYNEEGLNELHEVYERNFALIMRCHYGSERHLRLLEKENYLNKQSTKMLKHMNINKVKISAWEKYKRKKALQELSLPF